MQKQSFVLDNGVPAAVAIFSLYSMDETNSK